MLKSQLAENLERVRSRIADACDRSGRSVDEITLVAVTKYAEEDWVRGLVELGITDLGESRPQQLVSRAKSFPAGIRWHQIGHVQRNKVEMLLPVVHQVHAVDSLRLIDEFERCATKTGIRPQLLLEVNVSGEATKDGFSISELEAAWPTLCQRSAVCIEGLMTMAPNDHDLASARLTFRGLRELRDRLRTVTVSLNSVTPETVLPELSMGMSGDFEIGIEEGATLIRVGSSLFDGLTA